MKAQVYYHNELQKELEVKQGCTVEEILPEVHVKYPVLSCRISNVNQRLDSTLQEEGRIDLLDIQDNYANMSYQASLTLLYICGVHKVLGESAHVTILNSLSKGLFTTITASLTQEKVEEIEKMMHALVEKNLPIGEKSYSRKEMMQYLKGRKRLRVVQSTESIDEAKMCTLDDEEDIFYLHLLPSTGYLSLFELKRYRNGIILRFPHPTDPLHVPAFESQELLYDAFSEETQWENILHISYAVELNERMKKEYENIIMVQEALHEKKIAQIAESIKKNKKRIILIAGPSSSGKTSFAKRLCIQLQVVGLKPLYLGTDDYFKDRKDMVPDEKGNLDFESLEAVDLPLFFTQMNALLAGEKVHLPTFDFVEGVKKYGDREVSIDNAQPVVIEGIHGLNPKMSAGIPDEQKYRIYISPLTSLNIDRHHRIPTTDARMLRRIVRDERTRNKSAEETLKDWSSVRRGEDAYIFPYSYSADMFFNSSCVYELSVLKKYAKPLLEEIPSDSEVYCEAQRMLDFLKFFKEIPDDSCIVNNSLIREFIGGSILVK